MTATGLHQTDLFATPVWTTDLVELRPYVPAMVAEAERVLSVAPSPNPDLFEQSLAVLQDTTEPGWQRFFQILAGHMEAIVNRAHPLRATVASASVRSWVLRIKDASDFERTGHTLNALHSHLPSLLSSVFYLQVPDGLVESSSGGTTLRDPNAANSRIFGRPDFHVSAAPLRLVIFPSYLEHCPERPPPGALDGRSRLVVASDLRVELA